MRKVIFAAAIMLSSQAQAGRLVCRDYFGCHIEETSRQPRPHRLSRQPEPDQDQPKDNVVQQDQARHAKAQPRQQVSARDLSGASRKSIVAWDGKDYAEGSIVVRTPERALFLILGEGKALRYSVGVGREGFQWSGTSTVVSKKEWPDWTPPSQMIEREAAKGHFLPEHMDGGPNNPLGARALYLGGREYRIHGTNNEKSIGGAVSSGCIRMMNADVIDLYNRVKLGTKVYVLQ